MSNTIYQGNERVFYFPNCGGETYDVNYSLVDFKNGSGWERKRIHLKILSLMIHFL